MDQDIHRPTGVCGHHRPVFATSAHNDTLHLVLTDTELNDLIDTLAAESNHEPNWRPQRQLDSVYDALAAPPQPSW